MNNELCEKLAAHPNFPWGKGLTLSGDHVLMSDDTYDPEMSRPVYDVDEERVYEESIERLREFGLLLEHPTTIGWMFTDLVERLAKTGGYVGLAHQLRGMWTVHTWDLQTWKPNGTGDARLLAEGEKLGEALGRAWLASWENVE